MNGERTWLVGGRRTPFGRFGGALKDVPLLDLAGEAVEFLGWEVRDGAALITLGDDLEQVVLGNIECVRQRAMHAGRDGLDPEAHRHRPHDDEQEKDDDGQNQQRRYVVCTDNTFQLTQRYWPEWAPNMSQATADQWLARERELYQHAAYLFPWGKHAARAGAAPVLRDAVFGERRVAVARLVRDVAVLVRGDGTGLDAWGSVDGGPAKWRVGDGWFEVVPGTGDIATAERFGDVQLHLEWQSPTTIEGEGQGRGNSGVFLQKRYEVQILDSFENRTYSNGQAASVYKQHIPLVNATRPPGEWQTYDIVYTAARYDDDAETVASPLLPGPPNADDADATAVQHAIATAVAAGVPTAEVVDHATVLSETTNSFTQEIDVVGNILRIISDLQREVIFSDRYGAPVAISTMMQPGNWLYSLLYAVLIFFFTYFYTAIQYNVDDIANNLKRAGSFVPGVRPGKQTRDFLDGVISRITVVGAAYLSIVCLIPEILISYAAVPFYFGGTSLLIVVGVAMDTVNQVESQLIMRHYDGFMKKTRIRGRRG